MSLSEWFEGLRKIDINDPGALYSDGAVAVCSVRLWRWR